MWVVYQRVGFELQKQPAQLAAFLAVAALVLLLSAPLRPFPQPESIVSYQVWRTGWRTLAISSQFCAVLANTTYIVLLGRDWLLWRGERRLLQGGMLERTTTLLLVWWILPFFLLILLVKLRTISIKVVIDIPRWGEFRTYWTWHWMIGNQVNREWVSVSGMEADAMADAMVDAMGTAMERSDLTQNWFCVWHDSVVYYVWRGGEVVTRTRRSGLVYGMKKLSQGWSFFSIDSHQGPNHILAILYLASLEIRHFCWQEPLFEKHS